MKTVRKGVLLAGGRGSRLYPMTRMMTKHLLPVYDKPMICYPLSTLMLAGCREIIIVVDPRDQSAYESFLGDGSAWGMEVQYALQQQPLGLTHAFLCAAPALRGSPCVVALGDNLFHGQGMTSLLSHAIQFTKGATIFTSYLKDPSGYGVLEFGRAGEVLEIHEKPDNPASHTVAAGLYIYDERAVEFAKQVKRSSRGEFEITDLNRIYLKEGLLNTQPLGRGMAWLDLGTPENLLSAAQFVATIEARQGLKIGCPEEIAFRRGWISVEDLEELAYRAGSTEYGNYLHNVLSEGEKVPGGFFRRS